MPAPAHLVRGDLMWAGPTPADPLGKRLARLLTLHPHLAADLGEPNLAAMDNSQKQALLARCKDKLGL